jgi:LCP family protein required for cell wall assembly
MKNKQPPKKFDVHRTLPNTSYRPANSTFKSVQEPILSQSLLEKPQKRWWSKKKIALLIFLVLLTPFLIIGIWDARNASRASEKIFGSGNIIDILNTDELKGSDRGRVNVLLVGYSLDDPGHAGAALTDSIMILSMDTHDKAGFMLSVPRDLYVNIPDYGRAKINEAYQGGENLGFSESKYPSGGMGLLEKTVSENFDIQIDYYAIINYGAVRDIVNAVNGITVDIKSTDPRGIYDPNFKPEEGGPLRLSNGAQEIDGQTALRLTRARGSTYGSYGLAQSDFDRTKNQQLVLSGIKNEIDWKLILDPRINSKFFDAFADNVKTDVQSSEVLPLYRLFNSIPGPNMRSVSLRDVDKVNYLRSYTTPNGQSALVPSAGLNDFSDIQALVKQLSN